MNYIVRILVVVFIVYEGMLLNHRSSANRFYLNSFELLLYNCIPCGSKYEAQAIKCWVCRSDSDPKCADPFDNSTVPITDCTHEPDLPHFPGVRPTMCRKIRQKVHGEWRYFRSCAYLGEPGIEGDERFCLMRTGTYNIFMEYCTCNSKDGCNSAISYHPYSSFSLFTVSIFILIYSFR